MKVPLIKKKGRPLGSTKGKTKQSVTVMLRVDEIEAAGGMEKAREKIINNFSKL
jgi:hypothetical protein